MSKVIGWIMTLSFFGGMFYGMCLITPPLVVLGIWGAALATMVWIGISVMLIRGEL